MNRGRSKNYDKVVSTIMGPTHGPTIFMFLVACLVKNIAAHRTILLVSLGNSLVAPTLLNGLPLRSQLHTKMQSHFTSLLQDQSRAEEKKHKQERNSTSLCFYKTSLGQKRD